MYETLRIVESIKPKYVVWENVKNLLSKKHRHNFTLYLETMENLGYSSYYQVLNSKDYGIPQNRERVFTISIRKDIDPGSFKFPTPFELTLRLRDMLENEVDEKYYLSDEQVERIKYSNFAQARKRLQEKDYCDTLLARDWKDPKCVQVGQMYGTENEPNPQAGRIYSPDGISPTLDSCSGGNRMPKLLIKNATKQGYLEANDGDGCYISNIDKKRGTVQKDMIPTLKTSLDIGVVVKVKGSSYLRNFGSKGKLQDENGVCDTLVAAMGTGGGNVPIVKEYSEKSIQKIIQNIRDINGISNTITANPQRATIDSGNLIVVGNYSPSGHNASRIVDPNGIAPTVMENHGTVTAIIERLKTENEKNKKLVENTKFKPKDNIICETLRIRKLTPKECWRLMGFKDEDFEKAEKVNSNTQLYKQAGNSIVVDVLIKIFTNLFNKQGE